MEIQQIRYFLAVAELRNFTKAAERCNVTQPSLSQQIKKLEQDLGGPLFHRMGRQIHLTEQGEILKSKAEKLYTDHENTIREVKDAFSANNTIAFGAIMTIAPYLITALLDDLDTEERSVLRIEENFTAGLIENLKGGRLDFAIMAAPIAETELLVESLGRERFVAVMPKGHPLAEKEVADLDELLQEPFIELSRIHCAGEHIHELCNLQLKETQTVFVASQIETIRRLVAAGKGVTVLPHMSLRGESDLCVKEIQGPSFYREIILVTHPDRFLSSSIRVLLDRLRIFTKKYLSEGDIV